MKSPGIHAASAYAWELEDGSLCKWAENSRSALLNSGVPDPDARMVSVRLVRARDYNRLLRVWRQMHRP